MLLENVPIGMALDHSSFDNSRVYAEFKGKGRFSFHIYPKMNNMDWAPLTHDDKPEKALKYAHAK
jgi:hypothetical protein